MHAFELYTLLEPGVFRRTGIWCCGVCNKLVLNPIWAMHPHKKSTKEAAELCCAPPMCRICGQLVEEHRPSYEQPAHRQCVSREREAENAARYAAIVAKAKDVSAEYSGPISLYDSVGGDMGDGYFSDLGVLVEYLADDESYVVEVDGKPEYVGPEWAFACVSQQRRAGADSIIERVCSDGYDDMETRLTVPPELTAALQQFNELNATALTVYECDMSRKIDIGGPIRAALLAG